MKFERSLQIGESLFFRFTLAGDINFQSLRDAATLSDTTIGYNR
jgi:hypothetical protein